MLWYIDETSIQNSDRRVPDFAQHRGLKAGLVEAKLKSTNTCK